MMYRRRSAMKVEALRPPSLGEVGDLVAAARLNRSLRVAQRRPLGRLLAFRRLTFRNLALRHLALRGLAFGRLGRTAFRLLLRIGLVLAPTQADCGKALQQGEPALFRVVRLRQFTAP